MATIKDVAQLAGVSIGTVSRYVNGKSVKGANCRRIQEAIDKTAFTINPIARGLKTSRSKTIGVLVPDITSLYGGGIVKHVEQHLAQYGYSLFTCDSWDSTEVEAQKVELLLQKKIDGLIIYPCSRKLSHIKALQAVNIPVVAMDVGVTDYPCDQVLMDNIHATYDAAAWLFSRNHRRIGIINGSLEYFTSAERYEGYRRMHVDYNLEMAEELVKNTGYHQELGYSAMKQLLSLQNPPTAVIACNFDLTMGAMGALMDAGVKVPGQLALIGFDDIAAYSMIRPRLSVINQPIDKMGQLAADLIIRRIGGNEDGFPTVYRLKTNLLLRDST